MIGFVLATQLALAPEPALPDPRAVAQDVATLLEAGKINEAFAAIEAANEAAPDPRYLFMRAALEEQLGRCSVAVPLYREFHATSTDEGDRTEAEAGLERCGVEPEPTPEPAPVADVERVSEPPPARVDTSTEPASKPRRWQRDRLGWGLLGSGAAVAVAGGVVLGVGGSAARETRGSALQSDHWASAQRARRLQPVGVALIAVGSAVWLGGMVRMAVVSRQKEPRIARIRRFDGFSVFF